jgi:hypothetical protein
MQSGSASRARIGGGRLIAAEAPNAGLTWINPLQSRLGHS